MPKSRLSTMVSYRALIAPVFAELVALDDDAVRVVLLCQLCQVLLALTHDMLLHEARAHARLQIVPGYGPERALSPSAAIICSRPGSEP